MQITTTLLDSYLGHYIDDICPAKYQAANHCAHFVSHVMQMQFGYLCHEKTGVNVRVHEIFARCPDVAQLTPGQKISEPQLLFVTGEHNVNVAKHQMINVPKKHIGIAVGQFVWHYSNSQKQVVKQIVDTFLDHYKNQRNGLWVGTFPMGANALAFSDTGT